MNTSPVGIANAWSSIRADAAQQALALAVVKQQAQAQEAVVAMIDRASETAPPPAPEGQGRKVDVRV
jgi:hypothetical protein